MKTALKAGQVALLGMLLAGFGASLAQAKPEYTKKEGQACTTCHVKTGSKDLNDVGKCYQKNKSLKDCATK